MSQTGSEKGSGRDIHPVYAEITISIDKKMQCNFCSQKIGGNRSGRAMHHFGIVQEGTKLQVRRCSGPIMANEAEIARFRAFRTSLQNFLDVPMPPPAYTGEERGGRGQGAITPQQRNFS